MINGSCHCGAVTFSFAAEPERLTECNRSVCRRIGALWAHATAAEVHVSRPDDGTIAHVWGTRPLLSAPAESAAVRPTGRTSIEARAFAWRSTFGWRIPPTLLMFRCGTSTAPTRGRTSTDRW
jgi:hypothetical protein